MEQLPLKNADVLILAALTQTPTTNPDAMIGEFCVSAGMCMNFIEVLVKFVVIFVLCCIE